MNSIASVVYDGAVTVEDLDAWECDLEALFTRMGSLFYRVESRGHAEQYLRGLLAPLQRKNGWTIAEHVGEPEPKALLRFPEPVTVGRGRITDTKSRLRAG